MRPTTSETTERADQRRVDLEVLPSTWTLLHDTPWPGRSGETIDHIAIGPSGVFVIVDGLDPVDAVAGAASIARLLPGLPREHVLGVLVGAEHPGPWGEVDGAVLCGSGDLARLLRSLPRTLTSEQVAGIVGVVHVGLERADRDRDAAAVAPGDASSSQPPRGGPQASAPSPTTDVQAVVGVRRGARARRAPGAHRPLNGTT